MRGASAGSSGAGEQLASANPQWNPAEKQLLVLVESGQADFDRFEILFEEKKDDISKNAINQALVSLCLNAKSSGATQDFVHLLVTKNADLNTNKGPGGSTPLMICAKKGSSDIMSYLLKADKIKVNATDNQGRTALIYAVDVDSGQNLNIVSGLLENKANINLSDHNNRSALAIAVERAHADTVRLLLEHGADWTVRTSKGDDLFSHAAEMGYEIIKELLEKRRAKDLENTKSEQKDSHHHSKEPRGNKRNSDSSTSPARPTSVKKEQPDPIPENDLVDEGSYGSDDNLSIQAKLSDTLSRDKNDLGSIDMEAGRRDHKCVYFEDLIYA